MPISSKDIILSNPPTGDITPDTFKVETHDLTPLQDGQVLIKIVALGNLPAQHTWMDTDIPEDRIYVPLIHQGVVVRALGIGQVIESRSDTYKVGQRVSCWTDWRQYKVINAAEISSPAM
jgi:NADPH-dependent curcumin reductase CurA